MSSFPAPQTRTTSGNINQIEATLDAALEHASFGWTALGRETTVNQTNKDCWPPHVEAPIGAAQYHFAATIEAVYRAYEIVRCEQHRMNGAKSPNTETT